jgi:hypothetical protein
VATAIAKSVASKVLKGNISAVAEVVNRAEGTPQQRPEVPERSREVVARVIEDKPTERANRKAKQAADLLSLSDGDREPE